MTEPHSSEFLGPLLRALAESLDVREIFAKISAEAGRIVPHDFLMLGLVGEDGRIRPIALTGEIPTALDGFMLPESMLKIIQRGPYLMKDVHDSKRGTLVADLRYEGTDVFERIEVEYIPWFQGLVNRGLRTFLRIPVHVRGGVVGGLIFCSKEREGYTHDDFARAHQIADCVALALAHQRLAEEERKSAEARARAEFLEVRVKRLTEELEATGRHRVLGQSKKWLAVLEHAKKVAGTEATVLLSGESGTGKEVGARFIHRTSPRAEGPFVAINCAALPEHLLESELFGHEKGAFTGAMTAHAGKIEQASGGVLFLDEVGEMSMSVQAKFLRVLQEREYQRVGSARTMKADIRVLAATNRDLKAAVTDGRFREDLYYRLAVFDIMLPALRERPDDLPILVDAFLEEIGKTIGRPGIGISQDARATLAAYSWPGNVRELRNAIERAMILCDGTITSDHLPMGIVASSPAGASASATVVKPSRGKLDAAEREMILEALAKAGQNKSKAARLLGLTRAQLRSRIEKHGIPAGD